MKLRESNKFLFSFRYKKFQQELKKKLVASSSSIPAPPDTGTSTVAILFDATIVEDKQLVLDFAKIFERHHCKVTLLGYLDHEADTTGLPFKHFTNKDRSYFFIPFNADIDRFLAAPYDILINTDLSHSCSIHYLAAVASAFTKVGPQSDFDEYYHLIMDTKDTYTIKQYIRDLIDILNKVSFNGQLIP